MLIRSDKTFLALLGYSNSLDLIHDLAKKRSNIYVTTFVKRLGDATINRNIGSTKIRRFLSNLDKVQTLSNADAQYLANELMALARIKGNNMNPFSVVKGKFLEPTSGITSPQYEKGSSQKQHGPTTLFPTQYEPWVNKAVQHMTQLGFNIKPQAVVRLLEIEGNRNGVEPTLTVSSSGSAAGPYQILLKTWNYYAHKLSGTGKVKPTYPATPSNHKNRTKAKDPYGPASLEAATMVVSHFWSDSLKGFLKLYPYIKFSLLSDKDQADLLYALHNMGLGNVKYVMQHGTFPPAYAHSNNRSVFDQNMRILTKLRSIS